jgi:hypothetical protein
VESPSAAVLAVSAYTGFLLVCAWVVDHLGARSAHRSARWRTGNFVYHSDQDAWQCHEDQWLWPASFDPDKRVIRYEGQHAVCGRCPAKQECSPTPGPREITRQVDPWPYSDAGRFHRGIAVCIGVIGIFLPGAMLVGAVVSRGRVGDVIVLTATVGVAVLVTLPLARHLWHTPDSFPVIHLRTDASSEAGGLGDAGPEGTRAGGAAAGPASAEGGAAPPLDAVLDRYAARWSSDRRRVDLPDPTVRG